MSRLENVWVEAEIILMKMSRGESGKCKTGFAMSVKGLTRINATVAQMHD